MEALTPMMKQYFEIKKRHSDEILFFRLGDFYEMFFEDAHVASKILDIALTSRHNDVPMCGIPYHASESYIARLVKAGKRVAICEQTESVASQGGLVRREVVRIITPGTVTESNLLPSDDNNFLASVVIDKKEIGLAFLDISTGDFFLSSIPKSIELFRSETARFNPKEIVIKDAESAEDSEYTDYIKTKGISIYRINGWLYDREYMTGVICETFGVAGARGLGIESPVEIAAAGSILQYVNETQKKSAGHIKNPQRIISSDRMVLDEPSISSLEIVSNSQDGSRERTLFSVLNCTKTPMGRRTLERNLLNPILSVSEIELRLDMVQFFYGSHELASSIRDDLKGILDIERILARFILNSYFPRNFIALLNSLRLSLDIKSKLVSKPHEGIKSLSEKMPDLSVLCQRIGNTVEDDPALTSDHGRIVRRGFNPELDRLHDLKSDAKGWIMKYQEEEKQRLNSTTLKIKYNKIIGYYIEMSRLDSSNVPDDYLRKQTLVGSERFTTVKLQEFETDILSSSEKIAKIESEELQKLREEVISSAREIQLLASVIGDIDFLCSLSVSAMENRFVRPGFNQNGATMIREGRHPVVEKYYTKEPFVPNDIIFNSDESIIKIITGPNMSGKSTYIRMCGIIQLMAQVGSFVPAAEASLDIVDRIFTRIGSSDNISRGESTFLVEMNETANILNSATDKSLIIMDEVGRGTSTYDGLSIAWAVVEYILRYIKARTLFATHYHELTQLESKKGIVNYNVLVKEDLHGVAFLHRVARGTADKSYGIHVARLAGVPKTIISRAEKILERLESQSKKGGSFQGDDDASPSEQLEIFNASNHVVVQAIRNIDINNLAPLEALNELNRLKKLIE